MKKLVIAVVTVFAVAAVVVGGATADRGGTLVASGFSCGILDGNGNVFITTNSEQWVYQTKAVLKCSGDGAAGPGPHPKYFNYGNTGLICGTLYGSTRIWSDKVGYNGNSQLTCTVDLADATAASASAGVG